MPVFNGVPFLRESIRSVLNQSLRNFELICIARAARLVASRCTLLRRRDTSIGLAIRHWMPCFVYGRAYVKVTFTIDLATATCLRELAKEWGDRSRKRFAELFGKLKNNICCKPGRGRRSTSWSIWSIIRVCLPLKKKLAWLRRDGFGKIGI